MLERREDQGAGRLDTTDHLGDEVDVLAGHQPGRVGREQPVGHLDLARGVDASYGDPGQLDRPPDPGREVAGLVEDEPHHLAAHHAAPEHCHA